MDYIILDGTKVIFDTAFDPATLDAAEETTITASGFGLAGGTAVCVEGDEATVIVEGCAFTTKTHSDVKGVGILTIKALASDQLATQTTCEGKAVLLVGGDFEAQLVGVAPPMKTTPNGPIPGPMGPFNGTGHFENEANDFLTGT